VEQPNIKIEIICGNNIEVLKGYPDNYFDSVVTDPPYGLGKEPDPYEVLKSWIDSGHHDVKGGGFMGKEWDSFIPQPLFWKEVFRVLKHGGSVLSFFGTRTYDWGVMSMRLAGFEIRDCIFWTYGSGFPKSHNISKALDKLAGAERNIIGSKGTRPIQTSGRINAEASQNGSFEREENLITEPATEAAKQWEGWGSALKPAVEPIVMARKPLEKGLSIAENVLKWGTGAINIDGCRVNIGSDDPNHRHNPSIGNNGENSIFGVGGHNGNLNNQGRFPANLILTHHPECVCNGLKKIKGQIDKPTNRTETGNTWNDGNSGLRNNLPQNSGGFGDENGEETVEDWTCHADCPIKTMDEQSGESPSNFRKSKANGTTSIFGSGNSSVSDNEVNDSGGASRFFYVAKASKSERNYGLEGFDKKQTIGGGGGIGNYLEDVNSASGKYGSEKAPSKNFHPTVKPVKLMQYLVRLITPPNGIVLDAFNGSGTTGIACKLEGFNYVGIEMDEDYCKIARARIENWVTVEEKLLLLKEEERVEKLDKNQLSFF
jgi:site-specific DNA-methyltransferase (adenine-specific)